MISFEDGREITVKGPIDPRMVGLRITGLVTSSAEKPSVTRDINAAAAERFPNVRRPDAADENKPGLEQLRDGGH